MKRCFDKLGTRSDDIRDELKNLGSSPGRMHSVESDRQVTNPFVVPENYFNALPNEMLDKVKRVDALVTGLENKGSRFDKRNAALVNDGFEVPRSYFDSLPNAVLEKIKSEPRIFALSPSKESLRTRHRNAWLSAAAAVAAIALVALSLLQPSRVGTNSKTNTVANVSFEQISNDELYGYMNDDVVAWHDDELAEGLPPAKLESLERELLSASVSYDDALLDMPYIDVESWNLESL